MAQVTGFDRHKFEVMRFEESVQKAHRLLIKAADEWSKGNPEEPPTIETLNSIMNVLESNGFLRRPYGCKPHKP